jgi:hypothetical protein
MNGMHALAIALFTLGYWLGMAIGFRIGRKEP